MERESDAPARAGWKIVAFCQATGLSRSYVYALPEQQRPRSVRVGRRRVIIEAPEAWLRRVGASQ